MIKTPQCRSVPSPALAAWFAEHGFLQSGPSSAEYHEVAYGHTGGYGYITIRVGAMSGEHSHVIVERGIDCGISLGFCRDLAHLERVVSALLSLDYDDRAHAPQEPT